MLIQAGGQVGQRESRKCDSDQPRMIGWRVQLECVAAMQGCRRSKDGAIGMLQILRPGCRGEVDWLVLSPPLRPRSR
jgi:hypothetical protein